MPEKLQEYATFASPSNKAPPPASPLLVSTPPTISVLLSRTYPLMLFLDRVLAILTWTSDDPWSSLLLACCWTIIVLYFEPILKYVLPLLPVLFLWGLLYCQQQINRDISRHPSLDHMVHTLSNVSSRASLLVDPLTKLANNTTPTDIPRLALAALSIAPLYALVAGKTVKPRTILLFAGLFLLTYHSVYARATRAVLWRSRSVRRVVVYVTGGSSGTANFKKQNALSTKRLSSSSIIKDSKNATKFVFVVYENQRRWLGVGWTSNLLSYERSPWTDEYLNPSPRPSSFELPDSSAGLTSSAITSLGLGSLMGNLAWRWSDKVWKLDLTNDGALVLNSRQLKAAASHSSYINDYDNNDDDDNENDNNNGNFNKGKSKKDTLSKRRIMQKATMVAEPGPNDGWIYYDNTWKSPAPQDSFLKYTRRRRWVRTAELINLDTNQLVGAENENTVNDNSSDSITSEKNKLSSKESKPKKTLRFED